MYRYPPSLTKLIDALNRLPGVGRKTAERLAFYILKTSETEAGSLAESIKEVMSKIHRCSVCNNISESEICSICEDSRREQDVICVVEDSQDIIAIEKTLEYRGLYHVLMGALSPLEGVGPEDLKIRELLLRLKNNNVKEVILATNPNVEGEATATYLVYLIKPLLIKVTRLAHGLPLGGSLEYADEATLLSSLQGRREV